MFFPANLTAASFDQATNTRRVAIDRAKTPNGKNFRTVIRTNDVLGIALVSVPEYADIFDSRGNPNLKEVAELANLVRGEVGRNVTMCNVAKKVRGGRTQYVFTY